MKDDPQFFVREVRLDEDLYPQLNEMAREQRSTVADLVNQILRAHLKSLERPSE